MQSAYAVLGTTNKLLIQFLKAYPSLSGLLPLPLRQLILHTSSPDHRNNERDEFEVA